MATPAPLPPGLTGGAARRANFQSSLSGGGGGGGSAAAATSSSISPATGTPAPSATGNTPTTSNSAGNGPPHLQQQQQRRDQNRGEKGKGRAPTTPRAPAAKPIARTTTGDGVPVVGKDGKIVAVPIANEESICFLCAEQVELYALGECGHRTCHVCSIRMRALFKKKECTFCKTECDRVVFTPSMTAPYSDFPPSKAPFVDTKLGVAFVTRAQMDDSLALLRFNCPSPSCQEILLGWADLKRHAKKTHDSVLCELCIGNKKIFAHEHRLLNASNGEARRHEKDEHARCGFCQISFYDYEQLYKHCRERHEACFLCREAGVSDSDNVHLGYPQLETHFRLNHFLCPHPSCLEAKFVVFKTELDLQAHALAEHGAALSGDQRSRRDARRIETNFTYDHNNGSNGRAGPSGSGSRALPPHQRNVPGSARGGQASAGSSNQASRSTTPSGGSPSTASPEVVARHEALLRRVEAAVASTQSVQSFKLSVKAYRGSETAAENLVDTLWNIFSKDADVTGSVIIELAGLLEGSKSTELLKAWQSFRAQQNNFPSLAPVSSALPSRTAASWQNRTVPAAPAPQPARPSYPALPTRSRAPVPGAASRGTGARTTPWAAANSTPVPSPPLPAAAPTPFSVSRSSAPTPRAGSRAPPAPRQSDFPSLPTSTVEAERRARMNAALGRPSGSTTPGSSNGLAGWNSSNGSSRNASPTFGESESGIANGNGKKKGKVLIMSHGARRG